MTSGEAPSRIAVVGTGLIGTSIAMAAARAGDRVAGYDLDSDALADAATRCTVKSMSTVDRAALKRSSNA